MAQMTQMGAARRIPEPHDLQGHPSEVGSEDVVVAPTIRPSASAKSATSADVRSGASCAARTPTYNAYGQPAAYTASGQNANLTSALPGTDFVAEHLYTGQRWVSAAALYDYGARFYDPQLVQFVSQDPVREYVQPYAYVGWNPVRWTDPTGMYSNLAAITIQLAFDKAGKGDFGTRLASHYAATSGGSSQGGLTGGPGGIDGLATLQAELVRSAQTIAEATGGAMTPAEPAPPMSPLRTQAGGARGVLGKAWNLPNTGLGMAYGGLGVAAAALVRLVTLGRVDLDTTVSVGNNAVQIENHPAQALLGALLGGGAITLGNTISYPGLASDESPTSVDSVSVSMGAHELPHTLQGELLGPAYLPANLLGGTLGVVGSPWTGAGPGGSLWHGGWNFMESGPLAVPPRAWP